MCANYQMPLRLTFHEVFDVKNPDFAYKAEAWPYYMTAMVRRDPEDGERDLQPSRFGLIPPWGALGKTRNTFNARSETVATLNTFRGPWKKRQLCVIPIQRFYEPNYEGGAKSVRFAIERHDGQPFGVAGIWDFRQSGDGVEYSHSMLTINSAGHQIMKRMHGPDDEKRSIVILDPRDYDRWLEADDEDELRSMLRLFDGDEFRATPAPLPPRTKKAATVEQDKE